VVKHNLLSDLTLVYAVAVVCSIPPILLIAVQLKHRRARLVATAGIGALSSLATFVLTFITPWIHAQSYGYTLWDSWKMLKVVGDVFAKAVALASTFAILGATLWLAEVSDGKEVFAVASFVGFVTVLTFIAFATGLAILSNTTVESIGAGAWASLALFALNNVATTVNRKQSTALGKRALSPSCAEEDKSYAVEKILEEARKIISKS